MKRGVELRQLSDDTLTRLEEGEFGLFVGVFQIGWYVKTYAHPNYESEGRRFESCQVRSACCNRSAKSLSRYRDPQREVG
jgi:hypothetical protein